MACTQSSLTCFAHGKLSTGARCSPRVGFAACCVVFLQGRLLAQTPGVAPGSMPLLQQQLEQIQEERTHVLEDIEKCQNMYLEGQARLEEEDPSRGFARYLKEQAQQTMERLQAGSSSWWWPTTWFSQQPGKSAAAAASQQHLTMQCAASIAQLRQAVASAAQENRPERIVSAPAVMISSSAVAAMQHGLAERGQRRESPGCPLGSTLHCQGTACNLVPAICSIGAAAAAADNHQPTCSSPCAVQQHTRGALVARNAARLLPQRQLPSSSAGQPAVAAHAASRLGCSSAGQVDSRRQLVLPAQPEHTQHEGLSFGRLLAEPVGRTNGSSRQSNCQLVSCNGEAGIGSESEALDVDALCTGRPDSFTCGSRQGSSCVLPAPDSGQRQLLADPAAATKPDSRQGSFSSSTVGWASNRLGLWHRSSDAEVHAQGAEGCSVRQGSFTGALAGTLQQLAHAKAGRREEIWPVAAGTQPVSFTLASRSGSVSGVRKLCGTVQGTEVVPAGCSNRQGSFSCASRSGSATSKGGADRQMRRTTAQLAADGAGGGVLGRLGSGDMVAEVDGSAPSDVSMHYEATVEA